MVCDVQAQGDPFVGFVGMNMLVPQEGERIRLVVRRCEMCYLNLGYNVILESGFTFYCFV
jgi:hypothetical protein